MDALGDLRDREVAQAAQHVGELVARRGAHALGAVLEVVGDGLQRVGVDELAQLVLPEQLAQEVAIERQGGRAALRVRRVALVHVGRDVVEEQRGRERRGGRRVDLDERQLAAVQLREQVGEAGQVQDVLQALAVGLEDHRELRVALGDLEQVLRLQPLLPQRRALAGIGARDQEGAPGVLAEARAEQRAGAQLGDDAVLELVRVDEHEVGAGRLVGVGEVDDDPVVRPDGVGLEAELVADPRGQRQRPCGVDAAAERREDAEAPVADLVAEALDDDRRVARQDARRVLLLAQVVEEVLRRELVEVVLAHERRSVLVDGPAAERADRLAELLGATDRVAAPEGDGARHAGRGGDDDPVAADLLDPPGRRAEQERLPRPRLVDHLLVELADAPAVGQRHGVQAAVGDRARVRHRELARALAGTDRPGDPVPHDARPQLGELGRRVAAVEHVQDVLQQLAAELGVGVRARDERVQLVDTGRLVLRRGRDRDDLLGEDVEGVARHHGRLDAALAHELDDDRALEEVGAELGEDAALRGVARPSGRRGRCAAGRGRRTSATRSAARGRRRPCRCRARATTSPRGMAGCRPSAAPPRPCAPRGRASRGGRGRSPRTAGRRRRDRRWPAR